MTERPTWQRFDDFLTTTNRELPITDSERFVSYSLDDLTPEWQRSGRCWGVGNDYFFGDDSQQPTMSIKQVRQASKLCDVCPVFQDCLRHALEKREEYGVWAGTSGRVRRKIARLIDQGFATIDQVVEDFTNGQGHRYTPAGRDDLLPGSSPEPSVRSIRDEAVGEIA